MHLVPQPTTQIEWAQERVERKLAEQDRREWESRFEEVPAERADDETDRPNSDEH